MMKDEDSELVLSGEVVLTSVLVEPDRAGSRLLVIYSGKLIKSNKTEFRFTITCDEGGKFVPGTMKVGGAFSDYGDLAEQIAQKLSHQSARFASAVSDLLGTFGARGGTAVRHNRLQKFVIEVECHQKMDVELHVERNYSATVTLATEKKASKKASKK